MSRAADVAYDTIRSRILTGELVPGSQLKEEEMAELCGVSRTPVRDALRRLEAEMLVRRTDTQRTFVFEWSLDEVEEIFSLRTMIEAHAARRAAARATPDQLVAMRDCNTRMETVLAADADDIDGFLAINREFHALVMEAAGSLRLGKMRALVVEPAIVLGTARQLGGVNLAQSLADHRDLVSAFKDRDAAWAEAIMTTHLRRAAHHFLKTVAPPR